MGIDKEGKIKARFLEDMIEQLYDSPTVCWPLTHHGRQLPAASSSSSSSSILLRDVS